MSTALIDGLEPATALLLHFAVQQEQVPATLAAAPPLHTDPLEAVAPLLERGLLSQTDYPGLFELTPVGLSLREAVRARWPALHQELRARLIAHLDASFDLAPSLAGALQAVDRAAFVPPERRILADLDIPVPTGVGDMTTSAPHAIVSILRAVAPRPGERVLVCGAKGGVTLALSAHMVGPDGNATAIDWDPATVMHVQQALPSHPDLAAHARCLHRLDVTMGHSEGAPYQAIVVNGAIPKVPWPLVEQLDEDGGRLLCFLQEPTEQGQSCYVLHKNREVVRDELLSRFVFTPIYGRFGWDRLADVQAAWESAQEMLDEERE